VTHEDHRSNVIKNHLFSEVTVPIERENMKSEELYAKIKDCTIEEAKIKCKELRAKIKERMPELDAEKLEETLFFKLKTSGTELQGDKTDVLLVAVGPFKDSNAIRKRSALKKYKETPEAAVKSNLVRVDKETREPIPIDDREFFGNPPDPKRKNPKFKEDLPEELKRDAVFITADGKCVIGNGKFDGTPGQYAHITGSVTETRINVYKGGWKAYETIDAQALWDKALSVLEESDLSVPIESVYDVKPAEGTTYLPTVAILGRVSGAAITNQGSGSPMIVLTDSGLDEDVFCFGEESDEDLKSEIETKYEKGMEAIVFGQPNIYVDKTGATRKNIRMIGALINPGSSQLVSALSKIDDIEF